MGLLGRELRAKVAAKKNLDLQRQQEMGLWQDWKASGEDPNKLDPLMDSMSGLVNYRVSMFAGRVPLPTPVIEAEVNKHLVQALRDYDPAYVGKGGDTAQLHTHVMNRLKKVRRFVTKYQNIGSIPEKRSENITEFRTARAEMSDNFGREPSPEELAGKLKWSLPEVQRMQSEERKDLLTSGHVSENADPSALWPSRDQEVVSLLRYELSPRENLVMDYSMGLRGQPQLGTNDIAQKLNVSPPTVSRIKGKIAGKFGEYGGGF